MNMQKQIIKVKVKVPVIKILEFETQIEINPEVAKNLKNLPIGDKEMIIKNLINRFYPGHTVHGNLKFYLINNTASIKRI